jgi:hypothetical protein
MKTLDKEEKMGRIIYVTSEGGLKWGGDHSVYDDCFCGSGRKYIDCHNRREGQRGLPDVRKDI